MSWRMGRNQSSRL